MKSGFSALVFLLIIPIAAGVVFLLYNNYSDSPSIKNSDQPLVDDTKNREMSDANCHDSPKYFIVESGLTDSVGSNFLVKYKTSDTQKIQCSYIVKDSDFEIKNEWAEYFLDLTNDFLILDSGTGPPPRGLIIYDLAQRKKVFTDSYNNFTDSGIQSLTIKDSILTYWSPVDTEPTSQNCPELAEYSSMGLGAGIEAYVSVDLTNLTKKELGEYRCNPRQ